MKGQNTKAIVKKSVANTRLPVVGTKSIVMFHQANQDEQYIDLTNLTVPSGKTNPSPAEILKARIKDFEENLIIHSSSKNMLSPIAYEVVGNATIRILVPVEQSEIFTIKLHNYTTNGTLIADVRTPNSSGELLEGQTDYNLGEAILIKDLSSQWPIQLFRGDTGKPMLRNIGNTEYTGDDSIGNYQMIDRGDGYCQVIRFNIAGDVGNEPVMWATHGALGERPNLSTLQYVDKISGIVDKIRQDALEAFGFDITDPTRYDEGVPTNSDLKAFGDKVLALENLIKVSSLLSRTENLSNLRQYNLNITDTNWTTVRAKGIPYQTLDGTWRFRFNIYGSYSVDTTTANLVVSGVLSVEVHQAVTAYTASATVDYATNINRWGANSNVLTIRAETNPMRNVWLSGDIELASKPTWL